MKQQQSVFHTECTFPDLFIKEVKLIINNLRQYINTLPSISRDNMLADTSSTCVSPESPVTSNLYCVITPLRWEGGGGSREINNEVEESVSTVILVGAPEGTVIRDVHQRTTCIKNTSSYALCLIQSYLALMTITYTGPCRMCTWCFCSACITSTQKLSPAQCAISRNYTV